MFTKPFAVIISWHKSNHYAAHLKLRVLYANYFSVKLDEKVGGKMCIT